MSQSVSNPANVLPKSRFASGFRSIGRYAFVLTALSLSLLVLRAKVLDDFDDNAKTGWTDFTFTPGFGLPSESGGRFRFTQPPAGQAIFSASQKTSERFELKEGRSIEFRVDVVQGGAKDSFAVLAFIPTANSPGTLGGYGLAKSTTDILISKGINKYFVADSGTAANLKQENITLVLNLTARNGSVVVAAKVLDKDAANAVIWEKTVVDSAAADVLVAGKDDPAAPYITAGYFTLYLYQDFDKAAPESPYQAVYDNAEVFVTDETVLDDFNDNTKTGWTDFTFTPGFGLPSETGGQFQFTQPAAGQAIFSASQKTSRVFTLAEGERISFSADVVQGGAKDSFAVLAFIPTANSPGTLGGYGLAKSTTDILITKGINKYFVADSGTAANLKQENITLNLNLTVRGGAVTINARVLDKDANNAVIWEKTVVDTAAADVLVAGKDDPAAPYITGGYFTLYLYQDFDRAAPETPYRAFYDNAVAAAPPVVANVAPILTDFTPAKFASFLPASTVVSFKASDDAALTDDGVALVLNGARYTKASGLTLGGTGNSRTASFSKLEANKNYTAVLEVTDAGGLTTRERIDFDTFTPGVLVIESEDYNFGGAFIDNPVPIAEGGGPQADAYANQVGIQGIDLNDTRTSPRSQDAPWRNQDAVRMERTLDVVRSKYTAAGGTAAEVYDYAIGDIDAGEWLNYTRTIPQGTYEIHLRQALINMDAGESVLEQVTSDPSQPNQTVKTLGSFLGTLTGFNFRNTPLTDGSGKTTTVRFDGVTTLRLRQVTPDTESKQRRQNYLALVKVADTGLLRAAVTALTPANNSVADTVVPKVEAVIQNRDTRVAPSSVKLLLNGTAVAAAVSPDAAGARVSFTMGQLPPSGVVQVARLVYADSDGVAMTNEWSFAFRYLSLDRAARMGAPGAQRGIQVKVVQAPVDAGLLENSLARAEAQLAGGSTIPRAYETNVVAPVINFSQDGFAGGFAGSIEGDEGIPGQTEEGGTDNWAMAAVTYLDLPAGVVRFGVQSDDGYKLASGATLDASTPALSFLNGVANDTFDVVVPEAGVYGFRLVWYERGGGAYVEWFTVDPSTGKRTLVNADGGIRAYTSAQAPVASVQLLGSATLDGAYSAVAGATVDTVSKTLSLTRPADTRFFRISGPAGFAIAGIRLAGEQVVITYR